MDDEAVGVGPDAQQPEPVDRDERWSPAGLRALRDLYEPSRRFAAVVGRWDVDPDDLVQEAYAKVLRRSESEIEDLGPYVRRAIANLATDERRRRQRAAEVVRQLRPLAGGRDDYPSELADLMRLPARVRALLYLVDVEGVPANEACAQVDMSAAAARVALMRARRRLRTELSVESSGE